MATQPTETKPRIRSVNDELTVIAQRAQAFTNASGTAIALGEGNADEIICRARSGSAAPDVGAALRVNGTFTGLCIQSGKELRCDDAETDTRVDTAAIRSLGIRSMVVTPIRDENRVVGVLACFAPTAHAFTITHVAVLKTMADQITVLLQKERRSRNDGVEPESAQPGPKPVASASVPPPVVIKPATSQAAAPAPARTSIAKVETIKSEVAAPVPFPKRDDKPKTEVRASFGTLDSVAGDEKKAGPNKMLLSGVAVLVVAVSTGVFMMKSNRPSSVVPVQHAQEASTAANQVQTAAVLPPETSKNFNSNSTTPASVSQPPTSAAKSAPAAENKKTEHANVVEKPVAVAEKTEKPAPTTVAISNGPSRLSGAGAVAQNVEISPTLSMSTPSVALSSLARPVSSGAPSVAQSELEPMKVLKTTQPVYPGIARVRRLSGTVTVQVTVGKDGKVRNPQFVDGQPVFRDAAFDAVKQWQFKPAMLNGQPIEQTTQIKMKFNP